MELQNKNIIRRILYNLLFIASIMVFFTGFADTFINFGWFNEVSIWKPNINWIIIDCLLMVVGFYSGINALYYVDHLKNNFIMKKTWKCEFCSKIGTIKEIENHEPNCNLNPEHKFDLLKHQKEMIKDISIAIKGYIDNKEIIPIIHIEAYNNLTLELKKTKNTINNIYGSFGGKK